MLPGCEPQKVRFWNEQVKAGEILADGQPPDLPVPAPREKYVCRARTGSGARLAAAEHLLHLLQRAELGVVAEVPAVAVGDGQLDLRVMDPEQAIEVEGGAED